MHRWIPESPRWLIAKDRLDEAQRILVKYHGEDDREAALPQAEFLEIQRTIREEMEAAKHSWKEMLTTPGNRRRAFIAATIGLFHAWSGNGLISYYLPKVLANVGISSKRKQNQINLAISCTTLCTSTIAAFSTLRFGRRVMWLTSFGLMAISYWILTATSATFARDGSGGAASGTVAFIFIYQAVYSLMQPLQLIYISEIFPYTMRAKGIALEEIFNQAGSAFNQFVNPIGLAAITWKYYIVYCVWVPIEWVVMFFFYPETKGPTLEELVLSKSWLRGKMLLRRFVADDHVQFSTGQMRCAGGRTRKTSERSTFMRSRPGLERRKNRKGEVQEDATSLQCTCESHVLNSRVSHNRQTEI